MGHTSELRYLAQQRDSLIRTLVDLVGAQKAFDYADPSVRTAILDWLKKHKREGELNEL